MDGICLFLYGVILATGLKHRAIVNGLFALLLTLGSVGLFPIVSVKAAQPAPPPGPDRVEAITVNYTAYEWWMASWNKNKVVCSLTVDHEGQPTLEEVYQNCDPDVYTTYQDQAPCDLVGDKRQCEGYYLYLIDTHEAQRVISVKLPAPEVWLTLEGCDSVARSGTNVCENDPILVLKGEEPLPNEHIVGIEGTMDGQPFTCDPTCKLKLAATDANGVAMQFWAWSSYGDSSQVFSAQVRVAPADVNNPDQTSWYVDVLSSQWKGVRIASCSDTWDSFPPVGGPPAWLSTPADASDLSSDIPYNYLSANLILQGTVDASSCPDGGLQPDGGANECGQEAARAAVDEWQNQFDTLIMNTALDTGVPAQLLKNLFARESQFWPGVFKANPDAGLGQLTQNGADTTLLWNPSFYAQYCPLVLSAQACSQGYLHLKPDEQQLLQEALVSTVNATCDNCTLGIDLSRANFSVGVFAHTLLASCEQTGQVIYNVVGQSPGDVASYEDLWKFTLVNYNAGPGCLSLALTDAWSTEHELTWDILSTHFTPVCAPAVAYVNDISK
jgi:hypothetical protein